MLTYLLIYIINSIYLYFGFKIILFVFISLYMHRNIILLYKLYSQINDSRSSFNLSLFFFYTSSMSKFCSACSFLELDWHSILCYWFYKILIHFEPYIFVYINKKKKKEKSLITATTEKLWINWGMGLWEEEQTMRTTVDFQSQRCIRFRIKNN